MRLDLEESSITRVSFDFAVTLLLSNGAEMRIETEGVFTPPIGDEVGFDPEDARPVAGVLLGLLREDVSLAEAGDHGALRIRTKTGMEVNVVSSPDYEAWGIVWPDGRRVICMPGGELAIWDLPEQHERSDSR
ncbi:DUF6188 family protein [Agromyces larvae]|uniref:DUF6188 family protein n=1 Tax=Agromyces larvae TaxID=2929802 RepID=A0ABY4BYZ3_9MICO|nr:DUF6188 family protein [Agromyces larvae]UOE42911.1 DUF6188 family protein [Agromyces larvae]